MNVTVRFGSVAVLKRRFRFMRFGFSDGSCGSVRGSWWFQSPSPKSVENNTFWSLGGMAAEPRGGVHNSGVWGLKLAKRYSHAGEEPATRGSTQFGSLGPGACEKGTPTRAGGQGPATRGSTEFGSLGPGACEKSTPTRAGGQGPATRGSTQFGSLGPGACEKGTPTRAGGQGPATRGVQNSGVWGLELAKRVLPRVLVGRGPPRTRGSRSLGPEACEKGTPTRPALGRGRSYMEK